jgi:hypothetical protein
MQKITQSLIRRAVETIVLLLVLLGSKSIFAVVIRLLFEGSRGYIMFTDTDVVIFVIAAICFYYPGVTFRQADTPTQYAISQLVFVTVALLAYDNMWRIFSLEPILPISALPPFSDPTGYISSIMLVIQVVFFGLGIYSESKRKPLPKKWIKYSQVLLATLGLAAMVFTFATPERSLGFHAGVQRFNVAKEHLQTVGLHREYLSTKDVPDAGEIKSYRAARYFIFNISGELFGYTQITHTPFSNFRLDSLSYDKKSNTWLAQGSVLISRLGDSGGGVIISGDSPPGGILIDGETGKILAAWKENIAEDAR